MKGKYTLLVYLANIMLIISLAYTPIFNTLYVHPHEYGHVFFKEMMGGENCTFIIFDEKTEVFLCGDQLCNRPPDRAGCAFCLDGPNTTNYYLYGGLGGMIANTGVATAFSIFPPTALFGSAMFIINTISFPTAYQYDIEGIVYSSTIPTELGLSMIFAFFLLNVCMIFVSYRIWNWFIKFIEHRLSTNHVA